MTFNLFTHRPTGLLKYSVSTMQTMQLILTFHDIKFSKKNNFVLDFDDDNDITKYDLIDIIDRLTAGSELTIDEKSQICDIVSIAHQ